MSLNKRSRKSLVLTLGLVLGGVSITNIYAQEKLENKVVENKVAQNKEVEYKELEEAPERQMVTATSLNIRKGASTDDEIISSVKEGEIVEILETLEVEVEDTKKAWHKIKLSEEDGKELEIEEGWISAEHTEIEKGKVTANKLNVRKGPSSEDDKVGKLENGLEVEILEEKENWFKVEIDEKTSGWVNGDYVFTDSEVIEEEARKAKEEVEAAARKAKEEVEVAAKAKVESETKKELAKSATQNSNTTNELSKDKEVSQNTAVGSLMTVEATAYTGHTITATGTTPKWGTIAVDPKVIPYGTKVYIPQFDKVFIAEDCGGAIKGNKIDIFMNDKDTVYNWGRKTIEIQILG